MTMTLEPNPSAIDRNAVFERKRAARKAGIEQVLQDQQSDGSAADRFLAMVKYDSELAPLSTNMQQLAEIGINPPLPDGLDDQELTAALKVVIDGLADLGIYLVATDHLTDRELYGLLRTKVLNDEIRDIPPCDEMTEYINLADSPPTAIPGVQQRLPTVPYPKVSDRDASLPRPSHAQALDSTKEASDES